MGKGTLYLIPSLLADGPVTDVLPVRTLEIIRRLNCFIVEEARTARRFLISVGIVKPVDELKFLVFNEHSGDLDLESYLADTLNGQDTGLISEAGVPCVADPGSLLVSTAHRLGIRVVPLTGPSSILLALMASGFNGQNFTFHGYLPADKSLLTKKIKEIERFGWEQNQTQIFMETPYRNLKLFETLLSICKPATQLCIATGITGREESIITRSISDWHKTKPDIHKRPTIFILYR